MSGQRVPGGPPRRRGPPRPWWGVPCRCRRFGFAFACPRLRFRPFGAARAWRKWMLVEHRDLLFKFRCAMDSHTLAELDRDSESEWLCVHF